MAYIDTISNTLQNLNNSAQGLTDMKTSAIAQRLQQAELLRDMGYNDRAEEMLHSAKNYGLSSLFAPKAQEWEAKGTFRNSDVPLKQEQYNVNAEQGGILAKLLDPKSPDYNPDMANVLAQGSPQTLAQLKKMKEDGLMSLSTNAIKEQFAPLLEAYAENEKVNAPIREYNRKAEAYNKNQDKFKESYTGNEVDQQQQLLQDTIQAVRDGGGIEAYNKYVVTTKAIADHYGHKADLLPLEYFGLGKSSGGKGNGSGKSDYYLYGDSEQVIEIPSWAMKTSKTREKYISDNYPDIYREGTILKRAGTNSGEKLNPLQVTDTQIKQRQLKAYDQADANEIVDSNDGWFTRTSTAIQKANDQLEAQGANYRINPETKKIYYLNESTNNNNRNVADNSNSNNNNQPAVNSSLWRRK